MEKNHGQVTRSGAKDSLFPWYVASFTVLLPPFITPDSGGKNGVVYIFVLLVRVRVHKKNSTCVLNTHDDCLEK